MTTPRYLIDSPRIGNWMQTYSGRQFWPLDPRPEDIDIQDIAHALSMIPRYGGHCRRFYSVAEHSLLVSENCRLLSAKRAALLHDASEAYLVDIPSPIKAHLSNYKKLETHLCEVIATKYGVSYPWPSEVCRLDERILLDERNQLLGKSPAPLGDGWPDHLKPIGIHIEARSPEIAKLKFMEAFHQLFA